MKKVLKGMLLLGWIPTLAFVAMVNNFEGTGAAANQALDAQEQRFDQLQDLERTAPEQQIPATKYEHAKPPDWPGGIEFFRARGNL